jgi:GntR family transcriptional regulator/MocR family aminotransferase
MRGEYARRRALVVEALDGLPLHGDTAGLHVVVQLPAERVGRVVREAAARGVLLDSLERHHAGPARTHGLVIGYGTARPADLRSGCSLVRELARAPSPAAG